MNDITSDVRRVALLCLPLWIAVAVGGCEQSARGETARGEPARDEPARDEPARSTASSRAPSRTLSGGIAVGSWNIEWFGDERNGPGNEPLQLANAITTLREANADVWGIAEVVDAAQWTRLVSAMPGYAGLLASDRAVRDGARYYAPSEQKLGVLYRQGAFAVRDAHVILASHDADFAGRPPLEVRVTTNDRPAREFFLIVLHMKARNDDASWARRERAGQALKAYLDREHPDDAVLVVGDWNDGVGRSITVGRASPYAEFTADRTHYRFTSSALLVPGQSRSGNNMLVDHHLASNELANAEQPGSAEVIRPNPSIRNFRSTTSDHFPVVSHFRSIPP